MPSSQPTFQRTTARCATALIPLLAACAPSEGTVSPERAAAVVPDDARYSGEIVLRGDTAGLAGGSATISIVAPGEVTPLLARSWDLGDPAWRVGADGWRLYFALDARDAWPGARGTFAADMDLVARFDPDGNPATEEPGVARTRLAVRTGADELVVDLPVGRQVAVHALPGGQ